MLFHMCISAIFCLGHIQKWCETGPMKAESTYRDPTSKNDIGVFLGRINYLNKFSPSTVDICQQVNLNLNKDKCSFTCASVPFFASVISRNGVKLDPWKLKALTEIPLPKMILEYSLEELII